MKLHLLLICCTLVGAAIYAQDTVESDLSLERLPNEVWWGGAVTMGSKMPFGEEPVEFNLAGNTFGNQAAPFLVSSRGRYIWCEEPFEFSLQGSALKVSSPGNRIFYGQSGGTLRSAYLFASARFFPTDGKLPDMTLFSAPQYNTWIELVYDQNQQDVLKYAQAIVDNGFPPGVLMIDDNWQEDYGKWNFHPGRFPEPQAMMRKLHDLGFKVMLWVCPFVSPDSDVYRALARKNAFLMTKPGDPAMVPWWNGKSALLDLSNADAREWFSGQLHRLQSEFAVDGFKLDAGDAEHYGPALLSREPASPNDQSRLYSEIGLPFPLNEYRASWKMAGRPLVQRLRDKAHKWSDLEVLIPDMMAAGLLGYNFVCPDMIGGGEFQSFLNRTTIDQDLIVRSAQVHALAPMMQFSLAPWRVLDEPHLKAIKEALALRERFTPVILKMAESSAVTGEPILRNMSYVFPEGGYEAVKDQFMMGDDLLVAPMVTKGTARVVQIPPGKWKADNGEVISGPRRITIEVPLNRLPYFERQ